MANPRIEVEIGANVAGLTAGVNTATGQLDKLGKAAQTTAPQVQKLTQATQGYNSVGVDFARIIQDAPFGIIGIGNNITQLAGSFQTLKNTTGSTKAALTQAFSSIFSSGNALILGISLLTTAFTILQQKGFFKTEEDAKSLDETLKEYQETLTGVAASTLKGAQDAQKELAVLKSLELQATNTAISTDKRLAAVNELQKLYPDYFGNLTKEQILNGQVGDTYLKVAANLLAKAKAQAATNQIAQNGIDLLRIETKLEDQRAERLLKTAEAQAQVDALIEKRQKEGFLTQGDLQRYDSLIKSINASNESLTEEATLKGEIARINKENDQLTKEITKQLEAGATYTKDKANSTKSVNDELEKELKLEDELIKRTELGNQLRNDALNKLKTITSELAPSLGKLQEIDLSKIQIAPEIADIDDSKLTAFVLRLAQFNSEVAGVIEGGAQQTLGDFAFAIGDALASGGNVVKAAGAALLGGLAGVLNQLGQLAIGTGLAIAGIKKALQTLNPAVAIGAGVALIALAGFVSSKAKSLGSSNGSGGGGGGGASSVGDSGVGGGSSFVGGGAQGGMFAQNRDVSGEFVVRGQDLVYVLGQSENRIKKG
jgi:ribosomal protein S6